MPAGPGPERRVGLLQVLRHVGRRDRGAIDDRAGRRADRRRRRCACARWNRRRRRRPAPRPRSRSPPCRMTATPVPRARSPSPGSRCEARSAGVRAAGVEQRAVDVGAVRDRVGVAEALARSARRSGMLATSSPVTASSISSRSISSACFFAAAPTPSASSTDSALGATCRPTPASPNSRACSSTSDAEALPRQRQRAGKPADAAAGDGDRPARYECRPASRISRPVPPSRGRASPCRR